MIQTHCRSSPGGPLSSGQILSKGQVSDYISSWLILAENKRWKDPQTKENKQKMLQKRPGTASERRKAILQCWPWFPDITVTLLNPPLSSPSDCFHIKTENPYFRAYLQLLFLYMCWKTVNTNSRYENRTNVKTLLCAYFLFLIVLDTSFHFCSGVHHTCTPCALRSL